MSLFKDIPRLDLKPDVTRALSARSWKDYFVLLWWIFFFPQALRDYVTAHYQEPESRKRLLHMAAAILTALLVLSEAAIFLAQRTLADVASSIAWQGVVSGVVLGGIIAGFAFFYARSSEIRATFSRLSSETGQAVWRLLKPLLRRLLSLVLRLSLGRVLWPIVQRLYQLFFNRAESGQSNFSSVDGPAMYALATQFARGLVLGVTGGVTGALGGTLFLTPMLDGAFVDFTTSPLYGVIVGSGLGITLNLLMTLSEEPHQRRRTLNRLNLLGAALTLPLIDGIQSIANTDVWVDLSLDAFSVAGAGAVAFYWSAWLAAKRPLDWLLYNYVVTLQLERDPNQLTPPHVTLIPLRNLQEHLEAWLATNWEGGLKNADQLWAYTCQYPQITAALHNVLATLPDEQQVASVVRFVDTKDEQGKGYPWPMILYQKGRKSKTIANLQTPKTETATPATSKYVAARRDEIRYRLVGRQTPPPFPLDTAAQVTVAGFWYLTNKFVLESTTALSLLPDDDLSKELQALVNAFCILLYKEKLLDQPRVEIGGRPKEPKRKPTWDAIEDFKSVIRYGWLYKQCVEESKRTTVIDMAGQKLKEIAQKEKIARPDRLAILAIVKIWLEDLEKWKNSQHKAQSMKPCNPYICFEPIRAQPPFVGRDGLVKQLKQAWMQGSRQPVLLYGHAQTGKTSLIQRAIDAHQEHAVVVPIHLAVVRKSGNLTNRILWTMYQAIAIRFGYPLMRESDFLLDPYAHTERLIRSGCHELKRTLVLAIDEFDLAYRNRPGGSVTENGDLIPSVPATEKLLEFWWHLYRSIHNLTFVFIIQSPVDDFPESAFREYLWQIPVGNLDKEAVGKVLTKPNPDFSPLFTPAAVERIFQLTQGQPFLVQLLGHLTMQRFNSGLSKEPQPSPVFDPNDVDQVLTEPQYQQLIDYHVERLRRQLNAAHPDGEPVLRAIAQYADGITTAALEQSLTSTYPWVSLEIILGHLHTQGVVKREEDRWQVAGELLRQKFA